jgi:hypothetical protein
MTLRSRTLLATAAALAALPGSASAADAGQADPVAIPLTATLGSCSETSGHRACQIEVAFDAVSAADSYEAVIRGPDGAELVSAAAQPGTNSYSVPYRGDGTYRVRITAFGADTPD